MVLWYIAFGNRTSLRYDGPGKFPLMRFSMLECLNMEKQEYVDFCLSVANNDPTPSLSDKEKKLKKLFCESWT